MAAKKKEANFNWTLLERPWHYYRGHINGLESIVQISLKTLYLVFPKLHNLLFVELKLYLTQLYIDRRCCANPGFSQDLYRTKVSVSGEFTPMVTVLVPNHNDAYLLRERLDSIYGQTYPRFEVILLDDASTDDSRDIFQEYSEAYPQITRCVFSDENSGLVFNQWMRGLQLAHGELIWIAQSSDYSSKNLIAELAKPFVNEAVMLAYCQSTYVEENPLGLDRSVHSPNEIPAISDHEIWRDSWSNKKQDFFIRSAHDLVNKEWAIKNIVRSIGSVVFRHPRDLKALSSKNWKKMKIHGEWLFYSD